MNKSELKAMIAEKEAELRKLKAELKAIEKAGYNTENTKLALDIASSEWYAEGMYNLPKRKTTMTTNLLIDYLEKLTKNYPVISIEDGLSEYSCPYPLR